MKKLNAVEMRKVEGGNIKCNVCGATFSGLLGVAAAAAHIVKKSHWNIDWS